MSSFKKRMRTTLNGLAKLIHFPDSFEDLVDILKILYNIPENNINGLYLTYFDDELDRVSVSNNYDLQQALLFANKEYLSIIPMEIHLPINQSITNNMQLTEPTNISNILDQNEDDIYSIYINQPQAQSQAIEQFESPEQTCKIDDLLFSEIIFKKNKIDEKLLILLNEKLQQISEQTKETLIKIFHYLIERKKSEDNENSIIIHLEKNIVKMLDKSMKSLKDDLIKKTSENMKKLIKGMLNKFKECSNEDEVVHWNVLCNECDNDLPITGLRYKCMECEEYNLCSECEDIYGDIHDHPLIKFRKNENFMKRTNVSNKMKITDYYRSTEENVNQNTDFEKNPSEGEIEDRIEDCNIYKRRKLYDELKSLFNLS